MYAAKPVTPPNPGFNLVGGDELLDKLLHEFMKKLVQIVEVSIEKPGRHTCLAGDVGNSHLVTGQILECSTGSILELRPCRFAPRAQIGLFRRSSSHARNVVECKFTFNYIAPGSWRQRMRIDFTDEQKALRRELRAYFKDLMTPELRDATRGVEGGDAYKSVIRQMGKDGWLAIGWPKEYGGQGRTCVEQLIFFEEAQAAYAPLPFVTINTVAPALMEHGSEAHKSFFLPKIAAGELHFAIGYTEPGAGTDLASLTTRADRVDDRWVINGTKVFTSAAEAADYIWLAARTDQSAARPHDGISIMIVDTRDPGFSLSPIHTVGDIRTNVTYYNDVQCSDDMIAGKLNGGWRLITSQLNHERVGLAAIGIAATAAFEEVIDWARTPDEAGRRPIDTPWIQSTLAEANNRLGAMRLLSMRMAWAMDRGEPEMAFASAIKTCSAETTILVYRLLMDVVGSTSTLRWDSPAARIEGELEGGYRRWQVNTYGGGVVEVMRDIVAAAGLGMRGYRR